VVTTEAAEEAANEVVGLDLSHLHESVRPIAGLPAADRLGYVRADRWIGYPAATAALQRLETLLAWPAKQRMPNLLLVGPTNNGKSMIIEKFRRTHPPVSHEDREEIPVLVVQMPVRAVDRPLLRCGAGRARCTAAQLPGGRGRTGGGRAAARHRRTDADHR
jgi:hypothetical protein